MTYAECKRRAAQIKRQLRKLENVPNVEKERDKLLAELEVLTEIICFSN